MSINTQARRINDAELALIKSTFAGNDELLIALRKAFLGIELSVSEGLLIETSIRGEMIDIVRKLFLPEIKGNEPLTQAIDLWMTLDLKDKSTAQVQVAIMARDSLIKSLDKALNLLVQGKKVPDMVTFKPSKYEDLHELNAAIITRNTYIGHIEQMLMQMRMLAGVKEESVEETKKRLEKDSSK